MGGAVGSAARPGDRRRALGLARFGLLFLHFFTAYATQAMALLVGNVLGVGEPTLWTLPGLGAVSLTGLAAIVHPLLFADIQPELAEARGVSLRAGPGRVGPGRTTGCVARLPGGPF